MRRMVLAALIGVAILGLVAGAWAQGEPRGPSAGPGMMGPMMGPGMMGMGMMGMGPGMMGGQWTQQMQQMMNACVAWMGGQQQQAPSPPAPGTQPPSR